MITGELKNKVDRLGEMFWAGGLTNPLGVIEQITYLMFIRDLPDIVAPFGNLDAEKNRARTEQSFPAPKAEILGNGYDLSINKYRQSAYVEESYPHPREILAEINAVEREIQNGLRELEALLDG